MKRCAGILMPITSLPGEYGIGTMGDNARDFIDFLKRAGQSCWQILPFGPTGFGDSPYQSLSTFAGNPYWIDLDELAKDGLLKYKEYKNELWCNEKTKIDYGLIYEKRIPLLKKAANRMKTESTEYKAFLEEEKYWLEDYALFMAIKEKEGGKPLLSWPKEIRMRDSLCIENLRTELSSEIEIIKKIQFLFYKQFKALKKYAEEQTIKIIGDIPIYVSPDSVDLWSNPNLFQLDSLYRPVEVSGCPPDGFSPMGQLWGNPLYNWEEHKKDEYAWWIRRINHQMRFFDILRIDHFRGFESYYAIPYGSENAVTGIWRKGPGIEFFETVRKKTGNPFIIAEDLGFLTPEVINLVKETGYPGMKVLQFAFDPRDTGTGYLPHTYDKNTVVYCGTHDNDTIMGFFETAPREVVEKAVEYFHMDEKEGYNWGMIRGAYSSVSNMAIIQMQDVLGLSSESRINIPSTTGGNWVWRMDKNAVDEEKEIRLKHLAELYGRV